MSRNQDPEPGQGKPTDPEGGKADPWAAKPTAQTGPDQRPRRAAALAGSRRRRAAIGLAVVVTLLAGGVLAGRLVTGGPASPEPAGGSDAGQLATGGPLPSVSGTSGTLPPAPAQVGDVAKSTTPPTTAAPTTTRPPVPAAPPANGFPGPHNTGVPDGVSLRPAGDLVIERDNTVVEDRDIGCLVVKGAKNVTIRRSRIRCTWYYPVYTRDGAANVLLEDVEIDGMGSTQTIAVGTDNFTVRRADIHNVGDGPRMGNNTTVEDSWIHDLVIGDGTHNDGIQSTGGSNIKVLRNRIEHPGEQTSCILIGADLGPVRDVLIQGNLLNGGNYTVYAGGDHGYANIRIVGNRFGPDAVYGPHSLQDGIEFSGNVWHESGKPVRK